MVEVKKHIKEVLSIHFDETGGSEFWLSKKDELDFNPIKDIESIEDFCHFDFYRSEDIRDISVEKLIPKQFLKKSYNFILGSSGGRTGKPKWIPYSEKTYKKNIELLERLAERKNISKNSNYLFVGPTGPHLFGKRIRDLSKKRNGMFYSIDFDPRWIRKLDQKQREKYIEHLLDQAQDIVDFQKIDVMFTTPGMMTRFSHSDIFDGKNLEGIGYAGMPISPDEYRYFTEEGFPQTTIFGYYGNSMYGVAPEVDLIQNKPLYKPPEPFGFFEIRDRENIDEKVNNKKRGRMIGHRVSPEIFMPNFLEEDEATKIKKEDKAVSDMILDPGALESKKDKINMGIY